MRRVKINYLTDNPLGENLCEVEGKVYIENEEDDGSRSYSYLCMIGDPHTYKVPETFAGDPKLFDALQRRQRLHRRKANYVYIPEGEEFCLNG